MTPAGRMLRPHVVRRWKALAGAGGATVALTAADLAKPWPLALVVDRLLAHRTAPFTLDAGDVRLLAVVAAVVLAIARRRGGRPVRVRPLAAGGGRAHQPRPARARLRAPPAALARLPPGAPEGRPRHARHRRRQRDGRPVLAVARRDGPGRAAVDRDDRRAARHRPRARARRARHRAADGDAQLRLPAARARAVARPARGGGQHRLDRVGGAVGDVGGQGVRLGGLREPARARGLGAPARLGRRGGAAAGALRRARRLGQGDQHRGRARRSARSASRTGRSAPASCSSSPATRARPRARCAASRAS